VRLWGSRNAKRDEVLKLIEEPFRDWMSHREGFVRDFPSILDDKEAISMFFEEARKDTILRAEEKFRHIREGNDETARMNLLAYHDIITKDFLMMTIEGLNTRVTRQREIMLKMADILSERTDQKVAGLKEKNQELEKKQPPAEQVEVLDSLFKAFGDEWKTLLGKK
jgi:uncharacterized coiled-coil protein SlyX